MNVLLIVLMISLLSLQVYSQNEQLLEKCLDSFYIQYCSSKRDDANVLWNLWTIMENFITLYTGDNCIGFGFKYHWVLKLIGTDTIIDNFHEYRNQSRLFIAINTVPAGEYDLELLITHPRITKPKLFKCAIRLKNANVIAAIIGSNMRTVQDGDTIEVDGSHTYEGGHKNLDYSWTAERIGVPIGKDKGDSYFTAIGKKVKFTLKGDMYQFWKITLNVVVETQRSSTTIFAKIMSNNTPVLDMICSQNCPEAGNYKILSTLTINLEVICSKTCETITNYVWDTTGIPLYTFISYGEKDSRLSLQYDPTTRQKSVTILVFGQDANKKYLGKAEFTLSTFQPTHGAAKCPEVTGKITELTSVIHQKCSLYNDVVTYSMVQNIDERNVLILAKNVAPDFSVRISSYSPYHLRLAIEDPFFVQIDDAEIDIKIGTDLPAEHSSTMQFATEIFNEKKPSNICPNPSLLGLEGKVWEACQIINALMPKLFAEETDTAAKEYTIKLSTKIIEDMLKFPTEAALESLITVLVRLLRPIDEPKDRQYALSLSYLCKRLAVKRKEDLKTRNPLLFEGVLINEFRILKSCADLLMTSNYEKMDVVEVTTPPPLDGHPSNVEDYPSYIDIIPDNMKDDYMHITNNSIEIAMLASYIRVLSWAYGEMELAMGSEFLQPDRASLIKRQIELDRCSIELPQNLGFDDNEHLRVLVNTFNESLLFWESSGVTVNTVLVNLRLVNKNGNEIHRLPEMAHVFLHTSEFSPPYQEANANLPLGHKSLNDTNLSVYRIDMRNASTLRLAFSEMSQPLKLVIINGRRPILSDFKKSMVVSGIYQRVNVDPVSYDVWYYLGILPAALAPKSSRVEKNRVFDNSSIPNKKKPKEKFRTLDEDVTFRISVFSQQCVEWKNNSWSNSGCVIGSKTTDTVVHCQCYSVANVAAFSITPNLKRRDLINIDIVLEHSPTYLPLIFMICIFGLYCFLVMFTVLRRRFEQQIYYLSDNLPIHNYAYLLRVKSSGKLDAGTTANIVIKIHGEKSRSRPHVLNYPDPDKNLLQCGSDDYFVLTTRQHLGDLKSVELWSDCLQIRPTWRCDYVKICDLQKRNWYMFEIQNFFSPTENYKHYVSVKVDKTHKKVERKVTFKRFWAVFSFKFGAEHTWNIFSRKDDESFCYIERITVILCNISMVSAAGMLISCNPRFDVSDAIYDENSTKMFKLIEYSLYTSLVTFPISMTFVFLFRSLTRREGRRYRYKKKYLSEKNKYIIWIFLCLLIILCSLYVMFMGIGISLEAALAWITIVFMALLINIAIIENLFIGFMDFLKLIKKSKTIYNYENIVKESQKQKVYLSEIIPNRNSLRPYLVHLYKPMDKNRYKRKRTEVTHRLKISKTFQEFGVFILYFMLLYVLVALNLDNHRTILSEHMKEMIEGQLDGLKLEDVRNIDQLLEYLNETFILTLNTYTWYGDYRANDPGLMLDFQTKFLGVARFRQKKVVARKCPDDDLSVEIFQITKCIPPYSLKNEDKTSKMDVDSLWKYYSPSEAGLTAYFGKYAYYYGGGYIGYAGRSLQNAYYNLKEISKENWFDKFTRAVFIEFWAYNANTNLFTIVTVCFEFHPTGYVAKSYMIYSLSLMFVDVQGQLIVISMFLLYCILVFIQFANLVSKMIYQGVEFWRHAINYLDMIILSGNFGVIGLHIHKQMVVDKILDNLSTNKNNEFTKYFLAEYYIEAITIFIAILMCISVLGTWRFLRFGFMFKVFEKAIQTQSIPLLSAFIYSMPMYVPYIIISRILFGSYTEMFKNIYSSIIVISLLGVDQYPEYDFDAIQTVLPIASMIFYATYRIWQQIVVNLYIAIITLHYEDSTDFVANQRREFSILTYAFEELKYFGTYFNRKKKYLKGGTENTENVTSKQENNPPVVCEDPPRLTKIYDDEEQSSGVLHLKSNKLQLIALTFFACLYNQELREDNTVVTQNDLELMESIAWYYKNRNNGEQLTYYQMKMNDKKSHFMSKQEVEVMETITNRLFEPEPPKTETKIKGPKPIKDKISLKRLDLISQSLSCVDRIMDRINVVKK